MSSKLRQRHDKTRKSSGAPHNRNSCVLGEERGNTVWSWTDVRESLTNKHAHKLLWLADASALSKLHTKKYFPGLLLPPLLLRSCSFRFHCPALEQMVRVFRLRRCYGYETAHQRTVFARSGAELKMPGYFLQIDREWRDCVPRTRQPTCMCGRPSRDFFLRLCVFPLRLKLGLLSFGTDGQRYLQNAVVKRNVRCLGWPWRAGRYRRGFARLVLFKCRGLWNKTISKLLCCARLWYCCCVCCCVCSGLL